MLPAAGVDVPVAVGRTQGSPGAEVDRLAHEVDAAVAHDHVDALGVQTAGAHEPGSRVRRYGRTRHARRNRLDANAAGDDVLLAAVGEHVRGEAGGPAP